MPAPRRNVVPLVVLLAVLTACGGGGGEDAAAPATTAPGTAEATGPGTAGDAPTTPAPEAGTDEAAATGDGTLHIGYVLPETGPIAFLGPPQTAGLRYAIEQINSGGGVLSGDVMLSGGDEAGDPQIAGQTVDRLLADGVDAIVGAAASNISLAIIDRITGAEIVQCSASNTGATFTDYEDGGYYIRTVPSNVLQGPVLAEQIVADGNIRVAVASRADDYGRSLSESLVGALEETGAEVTVNATYDPAAQDFSGLADQITAGEPDAIALVSFEEGARILQELIEGGASPANVNYYGTDSMPLPELAGLVAPDDPGVLEGLTATGASSSFDPEFVSALQEANPELETTLFAPYAFDCGVVIALAAQAAGTDDPSGFVGAIVDVTREGTECATFAECKEALDAGEDIDYIGASGPLDFIDEGEPSVGIYDILRLDANGEVQTVDTVTSQPMQSNNSG